MSSPSNREDILDKINNAFIEQRIFSDLKVILIWIIISLFFFYAPVLNNTILRVVFALPFTLFLPGYVLLSVLYPFKDDLALIERITLSFGLSLGIIPLIGFGLNYTPAGIQLDTLVFALCFFIIVMIFSAQYRRGNLSDDERYEFPVQTILNGLYVELPHKGKNRIDRIISIFLIISILSVVLIITLVTLFPKENEKFTEFYILNEDKLIADYPRTIFLNGQNTIFLGINNYENHNITYTIEPYLVNAMDNNPQKLPIMSVIQPLNPIKVNVPGNETVLTPYTIVPGNDESNLVVFLLFNESVPDRNMKNLDRISSSYRKVYLWIKVVSD